MLSDSIKDHIKKLYISNSTLTPKEIKGLINDLFRENISEKTIKRILNSTQEYIMATRQAEKEQKALEQKIFQMYFYENTYEKVISKELDIPRTTVSDILKRNPLYDKLKEEKKGLNKEKNKQVTIEYIKEQREQCKSLNKGKLKEEQSIMAQLAKDQEINARSMSRSKKISVESLVITNLQEYELNEQKTHLIFNEKKGSIPCDLPKKVKVAIYKNYQGKTYDESFENNLI